MNRRSFLQRTGLSAVAAWLAGKTSTVTPTPTPTAYTSTITTDISMMDAIDAIDWTQAPLLTAMGSGKYEFLVLGDDGVTYSIDPNQVQLRHDLHR